MASRSLAGALFLIAFLPAPARADDPRVPLVLAQSGSAGGTIGKSEKSVSGDEDRPRSAAPARRRETAEPREREAPRRAASQPAANPAAFDGGWVVRSFGETCPGGVTQAVVITSGRVIGQGVTGSVSPTGAVQTSGQLDNGTRVSGRGQLTARGGQGTFTQSDGCTGRWVASKQ